MAFGLGMDLNKEGFNVVDVETTGLHPDKDRIIEIAVVHVDPQGTITERWSTLINPGTDVGPTHVHGISNEQVADAPTFLELAPYLYNKLAGLPLVAHNAKFDAGFITEEFRRAGLHVFSEDFPRVDTIELAKAAVSLPNYRLSTCCKHFEIELINAHCALDDTQACAELFSRLLKDNPGCAEAQSSAAQNMMWDVPDEFETPQFKNR